MILHIVFFFCLIGTSYARTVTEMKQWFFGLAVKCSKDYPVTMEDLQKMYNHKIPDNKNAKCLLACVYKKSNWMDSKGIFHEEKACQMTDAEYEDDITRENSRKVFEICKKVNDEPTDDGESGCDRAFFLTKCILETGLKMGFQI